MRHLATILAVTLCFVFGSCTPTRPIQSFRYYENAKQKPVAALVPLIVRDQNENIAWNVSNEITSEVQRRLVNNSQIYLNPVHLSQSLKDKILNQDLVSLTSDDLTELKHQNEYAVFIELIEHKEFDSSEAARSNQTFDYLSVKVRLRVFDLRGKEPKVLLQELLHYKPYIPAVERDTDYTKVVWGGDSYGASLYGRTHTKLEKDLVHQIETYISISK